jgi:threonine aldolase
MNFASDNTSPAHPRVMEALARANEGYAQSYGEDTLTRAAEARIRDVFEAPEATVAFVATGTAANALSAALLCPPWGALYAHEGAHIFYDECGAPEFYTGGAKVVGVPGAHGRIDADALAAAITAQMTGDAHSVVPSALSITNATEAGTVHRPEDVARLAAVARTRGLGVHMDGARLANALAASGAAPAEMTWKAGVDVLSLGGTKNGLMAAEAVVVFDGARAESLPFRRMRAGHLWSKHRFLAAQMLAYLDGGLWLELARAANAMAARLAQGLARLSGVELLHPVEANEVFAAFPRAAHRKLREAGAAYALWPETQSLEGVAEAPLSARMVASWCTQEEEVDRFLEVLANALG